MKGLESQALKQIYCPSLFRKYWNNLGIIEEYKNRFYNRLKELRYKPKRNKKGILTIGYDIFEDQTEQQMLSRKVDDYFPVVLSKNVHDALIRNGYKKSEFFYVPDIILAITSKTAAQQ